MPATKLLAVLSQIMTSPPPSLSVTRSAAPRTRKSTGAPGALLSTVREINIRTGREAYANFVLPPLETKNALGLGKH